MWVDGGLRAAGLMRRAVHDEFDPFEVLQYRDNTGLEIAPALPSAGRAGVKGSTDRTGRQELHSLANLESASASTRPLNSVLS